MGTQEKVWENRLRRMAHRQGYQLRKSRRRDPRAVSYGGYMVVDSDHNFVVAGSSPFAYSMDLKDVESWLTDDSREIEASS